MKPTNDHSAEVLERVKGAGIGRAKRPPICEDCKKRPGTSNVVDRKHFAATGNVRRLRLCDQCVRARWQAGDEELGAPVKRK